MPDQPQQEPPQPPPPPNPDEDVIGDLERGERPEETKDGK